MSKKAISGKLSVINVGFCRRQMKKLFFIFYLLSSIFLSGCASVKTAERPALLSSPISPFRASGSGVFTFNDEKKQPVSFSFPLRVWFVNSGKYCIYGDVAFDPKGLGFIVEGENWTAYAKPMNFYAAGGKNEPLKNGQITINPAMFFDFLANTPYGSSENKRFFFDGSGRIEKIEYLSGKNKKYLRVELKDYKKISGSDSLLPHVITYYGFGAVQPIMKIKLDAAKFWRAEDAQLKAIFTPPSAEAIKGQ